MKTKSIILIAVSAVITLSFTFVSVNNEAPKSTQTEVKGDLSKEPAGGFVIDEK